MATVAKPVPLPTRNSDKAPHFDLKKPLSLWDYFVDYEILADAAQLDDATKIKQSIIYLDRSEADFWESLDEYTTIGEWDAFKTAVLSYYPGSTPKDRWILDDLSNLCEAQRSRLIITRGDFAEFDRQFSKISKSLVANGLLSDIETRKLFWNALDPRFQTKLERKIELSKPNYTKKIILTLAEIRNAAALALDGTVAETSTVTTTSPVPIESSPAPVVEAIKAESFNMERFAQQMSIMMAHTVETALTTAFNRMPGMNAPQTQTPLRNVVQGPFATPRSTLCFMCGESDHFLNSCPTLQKYLSEGKLRRDAQGNYCLSHGERIPTFPRNVPWVQKVDEFYQRFPNIAAAVQNPDTTPRASANLVAVEQDKNPFRERQAQEDELSAYIAALQRENEREDDEEGLEDIIQVLETRVKKKRMDAALPESSQEKRVIPVVKIPSLPVQAKIAPKPAPAPVPIVPKPQDQQYRFQSPCEVHVKPSDIFNRILSQNINISIEELLALGPDIRKYIKEATTSRRIAVESSKKDVHIKMVNANSVSAYPVEEIPHDGLDAVPSTSLRLIDVMINDAVNVSGILDSRCQIVVMRKDVWIKLRIPLRSDKTIDMESANGITNRTLGLLPRVKFSIGDVSLFCPVQVVENAPFELLLGRPFTTCGQATIRDLFDGNMEVTLTDPRNGAVITCPTHPKNANTNPKPSSAETEGFQ